ncbi:D-alanine--D-alanine ligase [Fulvimarina sp. 2208YS6-2-32]|uniref:D-alanine--D-alanine ligase n=1 Tax=Fulvimarina uroteuthidis TaxID=3098149 RepID=A0ABU5HZB9_9HYPH|nr:D-alanine--D-alanine ligase [Fulvimarina sp. 2208YS6-2-32]MDY8107903.1 D-alanine--D-alanine ligase [Fulvimarina sp. 2208YS6-2-32]
MAKHVAVLMGGLSSERPVSLRSGEACADALEADGFDVSRVDVDRSVAETLAKLKPDVAFNALHGPYGEDGRIQGILEYLQIPYTHSGVTASALAMNKLLAKTVAKTAGVPVAKGRVMKRNDLALKHPMSPPYVIKPIAEGSSFGVLIVREEQAHPPQSLSSSDWAYGDDLLIEQFVHGRELTCAVMGDVALDVCEITTEGHAFYDYDSKYSDGGSVHIVPADIPGDIARKIQEWSLLAHRAIGCRGVTRSDFRYDDRFGKDGEIAWLEVNTQPGMTPVSLVPDIAAHSGHSFTELVRWMVEDASCGR